jgi:hypothetical protein
MLARLNRIALALAPLRVLAWLSLASCIVVFAYAVVNIDSSNQLTRPALLTGIWSTLLLSFLYGFRAVPPRVTKPWWRRWARHTHRAAYWFLAMLTAFATLGLVLLCMRLLLHAAPS